MRVFLALMLFGGSFAVQPEVAAHETLYCFDFGGDYQEVAAGFIPVSRVYRSPRYLWINNVLEEERIEETDPLLRDFAAGSKGEFWVGLDNGDYSVTLIMCDSKQAQGPFSVYLQDQPSKSEIRLMAGQTLRSTFPVTVKDRKLRLRLEAEPGRSFVLNGLIIAGPPGSLVQPIFEQAPADSLPNAEQVWREGSTDTGAMLRQLCDWLLAHRLPNGFLGDYEPGAKSPSYYWYTSAYPIRTWLAGYQIFEDKRYLDAVFQILDKLVQEQMPNGAWQQTYRNKPTRDLSKTELEEIMQHHWMNMADIGSIVTALAISCDYAPPPRRQTYLAAVRRYCDEWASQWQLPSGGFTNGMENGVPQTQVYSVATGTEASALAALFAVTQEQKYLTRAQMAAEFLLDNWKPDGRPICHPHHSQNEGKTYVQPVTQFGDIFYYHDGILLVYYHSSDQKFRSKVEQVYKWYLKGERGLIANIGQNPWWVLQDYWDNSKTAGMPLALLAYQKIEKNDAVDRVVSLTKRFLCTPQFSQRLGVMVEDPSLPWGGHSLQSWAGCAIAATGFAGLSLAEMTQPGVIYLKKS